MYYASAEDSVARPLYLSQLLCLILAGYHLFLTMISGWQRIGNVTANVTSFVRNRMRELKVGIERLFLLLG